ncbi:MAG: MaoC/PaaZ C-terminal domain-containing protein [Pseudomonadota bacterium]
MPLDYERLKNWREPPLRHAWEAKDSIVYALGLGLGADLQDPVQLQFVYEQRLRALPTMATVLAPRFGWLYRTQAGIAPALCVHGDQSLRLHRPLPATGEVIGDLAITHIEDKGSGKGAIVHFDRTLRDAVDGSLVATLGATMFCRGHGGFGGRAQAPHPAPAPLPSRAPDASWEWATFAQQALLYRQSGDRNPIHSDPAAAAAAGFARPILHGLCSFGIASCILLKERMAWDPGALESIRARFVSPLYPGETLVLQCWDEPGGLRFRCLCKERAVVVLDLGLANGAATA